MALNYAPLEQPNLRFAQSVDACHIAELIVVAGDTHPGFP